MNVPDPAAASSSATSPDLERLRRLLESERLKLGVHIRKMNSPGSPVFRQGENVWPAALILVGSFGATALVHFYLGAAVLAVGAWWWLAKVQPRIADGVFDRTVAFMLASERNFEGLWAKGVLSFYAKLPDGREVVATRRDDWREFLRRVEAEFEGGD
ncbi:hypothetical protein GCM10010964_33110 [Caldovatus sediminis]|uniref:Transmembrane protein n=1 Tax=Caldovatus sediminis TaxID=2041189 RepID=A0A8J2ZDC2_9PROT|nr:hypothetical protein [Caldovatus sediminis]GGG43034.1 hypothetical protein GCM10010964_33110 [Caldovatus sediminis]